MNEIINRIQQFRNERDINSEVNYYFNHPNKLNDLIEVLKFETNYPFPEYGSWLLCHLVKKDKQLVEIYKSQLIESLFNSENNSFLRNIMNVLNELTFNEADHSKLLDRCIHFIQDSNYKVALKVYSIYYLINYIKVYPELKEELIAIIDFQANTKSAAYKVAVRKFHEQVKKL